ncbi:MBL fold metallo-hydrolase [Neisseria sp.]|uniref:MBL fold metallo-hydrolase n=1 Tax=Neisseria sp. TaxID=192066 RepID=UPI0035A0998F
MKIRPILLALGLSTGLFQTAYAFDYQHIRNATAKITYGGTTFLVDPYLAPKGTYTGFEGTVNSEKRNPLIDMKQSAKEIIKDIDAVIVTHTHDDHWDKAAQEMLPKNIPVFVQNAGDAKIIRGQGFTDVRVVGKNTDFNGVKLSKTGGQHGTDAMYAVPQLAELAGDAMGVVFRHNKEKTLYIAGDTLWTYHVDHALQNYRPDVIVLNTGEAKLQGFEGAIIMGRQDVLTAAQKAPNAQIVTVHMDAVNHATVSRRDLRAFVKANRLGKRVSVPKEGEVLKY